MFRTAIALAVAASALTTAPALASAAAQADPVTLDVGPYPNVVVADARRHVVYVVDQGNGLASNGNGSLSIIRGTDVSTRRVGGTPVDVALDQSTHTAYVPVYNSESSLLVLAPHSRSRIPLSNPQAVAVDQTTHTVWVLEAPRILLRIEPDGTQHSYNIKGDIPNRLAVNSKTHIPYVLSVDGTLSWVASSGRVIVSKLGPSAQDLAVDERTGLIYVAHSSYFADGVSHPALLSVFSGLYLRLVDLGSFVTVGGLAVDRRTGTAAVALYSINNRAYGQLAVVHDLQAQFVTVGGTPDAVAFDRDGTACVANQWSGTVSVVQDLAVQQTVPTGDYPIAAAVNDGNCYVANFRSRSVTVVPLT